MTRDDLIGALTHDNVLAFLAVIRAGETNNGPSAYTMLFGGGHFAAPPWKHPEQPVTATGLTSTAAGAYQFLARTWAGLVRQYGFEDFSPPNQDQGAVALIAGRGALDDVIAGRLEDAIAKCNKEWASLPGSPYGQPTRTLVEAREVFAAFGGRTGGPSIPDLAAAGPEGPVGVAAAPLQPEGVKPMVPIPLLLAGLDFLKGVFPAVASAVASNKTVPERNVEIASTLLDAAQKATQSDNFQQAIEKIQTDPAAKQAAEQAIHLVLPTLVEAGSGGIGAARELAKGFDEAEWWRFLCNPQFWLSLLLLGLVYMAMANVTGLFGFQEWSSENRSNVVFLIVGTAIGAVTGFWFGTSLSSQKKDAALGART